MRAAQPTYAALRGLRSEDGNQHLPTHLFDSLANCSKLGSGTLFKPCGLREHGLSRVGIPVVCIFRGP